jgi:O-acetyl-ADP-ribose deacetylase
MDAGDEEMWNMTFEEWRTADRKKLRGYHRSVESTRVKQYELLPEPWTDRIAIVRGPVQEMKVDAIVNAAKQSCMGGAGVDGAIHRAAGKLLLRECATFDGCATGQTRITKGYNLPARFVMHTVAPTNQDEAALASCYSTSLELLQRHQLSTIAFCCVGTGVYGYPLKAASKIAIRTVLEALRTLPKETKVVFACFRREEFEMYSELLPKMAARELAGAPLHKETNPLGGNDAGRRIFPWPDQQHWVSHTEMDGLVMPLLRDSALTALSLENIVTGRVPPRRVRELIQKRIRRRYQDRSFVFAPVKLPNHWATAFFIEPRDGDLQMIVYDGLPDSTGEARKVYEDIAGRLQTSLALVCHTRQEGVECGLHTIWFACTAAQSKSVPWFEHHPERSMSLHKWRAQLEHLAHGISDTLAKQLLTSVPAKGCPIVRSGPVVTGARVVSALADRDVTSPLALSTCPSGSAGEMQEKTSAVSTLLWLFSGR